MVHNLLLNGNHLLVNEGVLLQHRLLLLNHLLVRLVVVVVLLLGRGLLEVGLRRQLELSLAHGHLGGLNLLPIQKKRGFTYQARIFQNILYIVRNFRY